MPGDPEDLAKALWRAPVAEQAPAAEQAPVMHGKPPSGLWVIAAVFASLFLPGAGQLMNRDWGRAAFIFVVWMAAWITHLVPVWTIACLYAGFEAGWAGMKQRRLHRQEGERAQR